MAIKIAALGAGSFVFGPSLLRDAILTHRLPGLHMALMDPDREVVELMAGLGRRMAREAGVEAAVTAHTERGPALEGADFVVCSAAVQMRRRFAMDVEIIRRHAPGHLITEFGGINGLISSLRQIALIEEIAADVRRWCPGAWFLDVANPLPRVCQAAHELGLRTVGFCSVSLQAYGMVWELLHGEQIHYPFEPARSRLDVVIAGVNHFAFLVRCRDRQTGEDLLPTLRRRVLGGATSGHPVCEWMLADTGYPLTAGDGHVMDFLPPREGARSLDSTSHGTEGERRERMQLLRDAAEGRADWAPLVAHESWEKPVELVAALTSGKPAAFHALNLANGGQVPQLPAGVFVETPARATRDGVEPQTVELPAEVTPYVRQTALVHDTIVRAALQRSRPLARAAVMLDPTCTDKTACLAALEACLQAHQDVLPPYGS